MVPFVVFLLLLISVNSRSTASNVTLRAKGLVPAVYTPFDSNDKLNLAVIPEYASYLKKNGVNGVMVAGTSGEGPSLSLVERKQLLDAWVREAESLEMTVVMQVGGLPLPEVLDLAAYSQLAGAHAIMTLPEMFFKPASDELNVHYLKVVSAAAPKLPILYYHHPTMSNVNINPAKFFKEAATEVANFRGLKCGLSIALDIPPEDLEVHDDLRMYMMNAKDIAASYMYGFNSSMAGTINIFPKIFTAIEAAVNSGDVARAKRLQEELNERASVITSAGDYVSCGKAAFEMLTKVKVGDCRNPLSRVTKEQKKMISDRMKEMNVKYYDAGYY